MTPPAGFSLGIDLVEVARVERAYRRFGRRFLRRVLHEEEVRLFDGHRRWTFLAGRFAAKEAFRKAYGRAFRFRQVALLADDSGRLAFFLDGERRPDVQVSITHTRQLAAAVCLIRENVAC